MSFATVRLIVLHLMIFRLLYLPKPLRLIDQPTTRRETEENKNPRNISYLLHPYASFSIFTIPAPNWGPQKGWGAVRLAQPAFTGRPGLHHRFTCFHPPGIPQTSLSLILDRPRRRLCFLRYFKCQKSRWSDLGPKIKHEHSSTHTHTRT